MNPYYFVLDDFSDTDMEVVRNLFYTKLHPMHKEKVINSVNKSTAMHQVITYFNFDNIELSSAEESLFLKYPMLGTHCLINESGPLGGTNPHSDGDSFHTNRQCAINFPIVGGNSLSPTIFFGQLNDYEHYYDESRRTTYVKEGVHLTEKDRVYLVDKPVLINVKAWHTVKNFSTKTRIAFSWSCKPGITFDTAYSILTNKLK